MIFRTVLLCLPLTLSSLAADSADSVLARMDREAAGFRQLSAKLVKTTYTAVLKDTTKESGTIRIRRSGKNVQVLGAITDPEPRSFSLDGATGQIFYPKINTVQIYDLGKNKSLVDQFMLLGFGSSGKDIAKNYTVKAAGEDSVNGIAATRLELRPKSQKVEQQIESVDLWVPANAGHPIQQKFHQPGGDYYLVTYSDLQVNPGLPENAFRLELPAAVKREYPQR